MRDFLTLDFRCMDWIVSVFPRIREESQIRKYVSVKAGVLAYILCSEYLNLKHIFFTSSLKIKIIEVIKGNKLYVESLGERFFYPTEIEA